MNQAGLPIWWHSPDEPPPTSWIYMFESFTAEETADQWGLAAAIFIARTRRKTGQGPTFAELFRELMPGTRGVPSEPPKSLDGIDRRRLVSDFRIHAAIEWKRRGWISWDHRVKRSLRVGRVFRTHCRARRYTSIDHP